MMRAARLHRPRSAEAAEDLRIDELPLPEPGEDEVVVRVHACGLCASDLHVVQGITPSAHLPIILGHEAAGTVDAVGPGVDDWRAGDRVLIPAGRPCGRCPMCLGGRDNLCASVGVLGVTVDGAQATHAVVPARLLIPVPSSLPFAQAAILGDAVATPYHALKRAGVTDGLTCVVVGLGGLGMHAVQLARLVGAHVIGVDIDPVSLDRALEWGAAEVVDASAGDAHDRVRQLTEGGADVALEFVGVQQTVHSAIRCLRPGGRATLVGLSRDRLNVHIAHLVASEIDVVGSFGATMQDINELLDLVEDGRLDLTRSVSHVMSLDEFPTALRMLESREGSPVRIVIDHEPG